MATKFINKESVIKLLKRGCQIYNRRNQHYGKQGQLVYSSLTWVISDDKEMNFNVHHSTISSLKRDGTITKNKPYSFNAKRQSNIHIPTKTPKNTCKNCKHFEWAISEFGFCRLFTANTQRYFLEDETYDKKNGATDDSWNNYIKEEGIVIRVGVYNPKTLEEVGKKAEHGINFYINKGFGCNRFKSKKLKK